MRTDWVAHEPLNYLERLFVRRRLQKCSAFQVSVFIRWNKALSVRNKLTVWQWCTQCPLYCIPQLAPPIVFNTQSWWSCRVILWHYSQDGFHFMHNQCYFYTWLGFHSLDPNSQHPITARHSRCCRGTMKWHNNPRQPFRSSRARRVATLSLGSGHTAKELKSQNTWVTASDVHTSLYVSLTTCDWWGACRGSNSYCSEMARPRKTRSERSIYRIPMIFCNLYCCCLKHVIFLCKMWCQDGEEISLHKPYQHLQKAIMSLFYC